MATVLRETAKAMGVCTALTADESERALSHLARMLGVSDVDSPRLGSVLVALEQNAATGHAGIIDIALRISPMCAAAGMSPGQALAISATFATTATGRNAASTFIELLKVSEKAWRENAALAAAAQRWSN